MVYSCNCSEQHEPLFILVYCLNWMVQQCRFKTKSYVDVLLNMVLMVYIHFSKDLSLPKRSMNTSGWEKALIFLKVKKDELPSAIHSIVVFILS